MACMYNQLTMGKQAAASPAGNWELKAGQVNLKLTLNPDGTGTLNGVSIKWQLNQGVMIVNDGAATMMYKATMTADSLTLAGANLQQPLTFQRVGEAADEQDAPDPEVAGPAGTWRREGNGQVHNMSLRPDGSGAVDGIAFEWKFNQNTLMLRAGNETLMYKASMAPDSMILSGGNLPQPVVWQRAGKSTGVNERGTTKKAAPASGLAGRWQGPDGVVEFKPDNSMTINGTNYLYRVQGNLITVTGNDGSIQVPFRLDGDTLSVEVNGRPQTLKRISEEAPQAGGGSIRQELVGKWCYISSSNTYGGSRMSNVCVTLYANGTFEYYGETSTSVQAGSSGSQQADSGTWTATDSSITSHSRTNGTKTFSLRKMNHPKNGDPMLVIDGQWFVTTTQRPPW